MSFVRGQHDRKACSYHFGRMVTEKLGGELVLLSSSSIFI